MAKKTISEKIAELQKGMEWFDSEEFALEKAGAKYKELTAAAKEIERDLNELKNEIEVIAKDFSTES